jgi:hypothetical protein
MPSLREDAIALPGARGVLDNRLLNPPAEYGDDP